MEVKTFSQGAAYASLRRSFQDVANLRCVRCYFAEPQGLEELRLHRLWTKEHKERSMK